MNELAVKLNKTLEGTSAFRMLSDYGKRIYFPSNGIVAQSGEAKEKATRHNATIGMACLNKKAIETPLLKSMMPTLSEDEAVSYSASTGELSLRKKWKEEIKRKNPDLSGAEFSLPVVVAGLTCGISQVLSLFINKGETVVLPDLYWDNYDLIIEETREATVKIYPFFGKNGKMDLVSFKKGLMNGASNGKKIVTIINFPNNPSGYSPSTEEAQGIADTLLELAQNGYELTVITDDSYFGLFYEKETYKQSVFSKIANLHENIVAVKIDGPTKEHFVWGFRLGFVSFASKGMTEPQLNALVSKLGGSLRATISSCTKPGQVMMEKLLSNPEYEGQRIQFDQLLEARYHKAKEVISKLSNTTDKITPVPFNSGYFMCFAVKGSSEQLRKNLLEEEQIGLISLQDRLLRVAYSAVNLENIEDLYTRIYKAAASL